MNSSDERISDFVTHFRSEKNTSKIRGLLPKDQSVDRFSEIVIRAVQENPALLAVDNKTSLFLACQQAAQAGLIPDGKEGVLVVYRNAVRDDYGRVVKKGDRVQYESGVQWQPMVGGLRKRLAFLGWDIDAQVVYQNDKFYQEAGENPVIHHVPTPLGQPTGEIVGFYAIARGPGGIVKREVMRPEDIEKVRNFSKAKTGSAWTEFFSEMGRKTVLRRCAKNLPITDTSSDAAIRFQEAIRGDNEHFDFDAPAPPSEAATQAQEAFRQLSKPDPSTWKLEQAIPVADKSEIEDVPLSMNDPLQEENFAGKEPDF